MISRSERTLSPVKSDVKVVELVLDSKRTQDLDLDNKAVIPIRNLAKEAAWR
jgi:hypothetical protein